jgi:tetratricopeptide (TPR) repeat protein
MQNTKIFLASSSELKKDRSEFESFINRKNKAWVAQGAFLELILWEDFLDTVSQTRLQDEYNRAVRECDIFVMLFCTKVGRYTEEEFKTAFGQFKETSKPLIFAYFKDAPTTIGSVSREDMQSLWAFQDELKALGHFHTVYENIDALKLHFNLQLDRLAASGLIELKANQAEGHRYDVLVSYRWVSPDQEWVREELLPALRSAGLSVFLDIEDFVPGRNVLLEMTRAGQGSRKVICVLSPEYFEGGRMAYFKSLAARASDSSGADSRLIPLVYRSTTLPIWLSHLVSVDWTEASDRPTEWQRLLRVLGVDRAHWNRANVGSRLPSMAPHHPIPNNLPRLQYFVGRDKELAIVAKAIAVESRGWGALIDGPGGIGKTALAIRAAELAPPRFERIIFLSAKRHELTADGRLSLESFVLPGYLEMLNAIARKIGRPELAHAKEGERADLVQSELETRKILLILDNLEEFTRDDRNNLFQFLNFLPKSCSAIVTSRRRADASAIILRLDQLNEQDANDLMDKLSGNNQLLRQASEAERGGLYRQTAGNPLLIRWVVGQLGRGHCRTIGSALDFLRSAPPGNDPLEFIFGDLLKEMNESESRVLAVLSHFTAAVGSQLVAVLAGINEQAAQFNLTSLSNRALVIPDVEERRFALAPMVGEFLRRKRSDMVEQMGGRLEARAAELIVTNGYHEHHRYPELEAAWPMVAAALPLFLAGPNRRLQEVCDALHVFLDFTGHWDEWLSLNEKAEQRAIAEGDYYEAGWRAWQAGRVHRLRYQAGAVLACADRAEEHWRKTQTPDYPGVRAGTREEGNAHTLHGKAHFLREDFSLAIECFTVACDVLRPAYHASYHASRDYASALNGLAEAVRFSKDLDGAERHYRDALAIAQSIRSRHDVAVYTGNMAALALDRKDFRGAEELALDALSKARQVGRQELIAASCRRLSEAYVGQGRREEGRTYALQAAEIYARLGSPYLEIAHSMLSEFPT